VGLDNRDDNPPAISSEERRAYDAVHELIRLYPRISPFQACALLGINPQVYWRAMKLIARDKEAFDFPDDDRLRPADPLFKKPRREGA
jgi:hypothetical protein